MNTLFKALMGFLFAICITFNSYGQLIQNRGLQSPTAASLGSYGDTPVSLYRGQAQVSIPLHTISYGDIQIPIGLSYSGSGLKVAEVPGWVGLGWSLNAGGVITRTTRGIFDEKVGQGYLDVGSDFETAYNADNHMLTTAYFLDMFAGTRDSEPDVFFYNFGGFSGKFIFDPDGNIVVLSGDALKVTMLRSGNTITQFAITDPNGIIYTFSERETTQTISAVQSGPSGSTSLSANTTYTSAWYLKTITSQATSRSVTFNYNTYSGVTRDRTDYEEQSTGGTVPEYIRVTTEDVNSTFRHVSSIVAGNETVYFYNDSRTDFSGERKLYQVKVNRNGSQLMRYDLSYSYTTPRSSYGNSRLLLTSVTPRGTDNVASAGWTMTYNSGVTPSITSEAYDRWGYYNGKHGNEGGTLLSAHVDLQNGITYAGDDRTAVTNSAKVGMLNKLTYPTGGHTAFDYEGQTYVQYAQGPFLIAKDEYYALGGSALSGNSPTFTVGGDQSSVSMTLVVTGLGDGGIGGGGGGFGGGGFGGGCSATAELQTSTGGFVSGLLIEGTNTVSVSPGSYRIRLTRTSTSCNPTVDASWTEQTSTPTQNIVGGGLRIYKITQHDGVSTANDIEKTYHYTQFASPTLSSGYVATEMLDYYVYNYSTPLYYRSSSSLMPLGESGSVGYAEVEERISGGQGGYTRYRFSDVADEPAIGYQASAVTSKEHERGQLEWQGTYTSTGQLVSSVTNTYTTVDKSAQHGSNAVYGYIGIKGKAVGGYTNDPTGNGHDVNGSYTWGEYRHSLSWRNLQNTVTRTYDPITGDSFTTQTDYYYNNNDENPKLITEQKETNSNGEIRRTLNTYAHNIYGGSMVTQNRLALPYATEVRDNSNKTLSKNWTTWSTGISGSGGKWQPYQTWQWRGSSSTDAYASSSPSTSESNVTATVNTYDTYGNPLQITDAAGNITKYYFGTNSSPFLQSSLNGVAGVYLTGVQKVKGGSNCNNCGTRPTSGDDLFTEAEYDSRGRMTKMFDENNKSTQYTYDALSRLVNTYNQNGSLVSTNQYYFSKLGNGGNYSASDPNRIQTLTYAPGGTITSVNYMDGLGRSMQTQQRGGGKTIISGTRFNDEGLPAAVSQPIEKSNYNTFHTNLFNGTGSFTPGNALPSNSAIQDYWDSQYGISSSNGNYAYTYSEYELSPLNRGKESTIPGYYTRNGSGREVLTTYGLNTTETFATSAQGSTPAKTWGTKKLFKTITEDADNKKTIVYTDGWGQTIASGTDMNGDGKLVRGSSGDLVTEYAYDLRGLMVRSEDPRGLATTYTYDQRGLLVEKKLPDQTHPHKYRYDKKGRLRFHRDPVRDAADNHYYYTKYDQFDRPYEVGKYNSSSYFDTQSYIDNATWPTSNKTGYVYYTYDGSSAYSGAANTKGRLTRTQYWDFSTSSWGYTWYSYDNLGLNAWVVQRLPGLSGDKRVEYEYDLLGRMTRLKYNPSGSSEDHFFWYEYDGLGRLQYVYSNTTNSTSGRIKEAEYSSYLSDGQVKQLKLGNSNVQTVDYSYTVQGWLDLINYNAISGSDKFGMNLNYTNGGNVSLQQFRQAGASNTNLLTTYYYYDNANRLTSTNFSGSGYGSTSFDASYSYDANGNVTKLSRNGNGTYPYESIPFISYSSTSNRINYVTYLPGPTTPVVKSVSYDANGNTTVHQVQGITATSYDWRNLPYSVSANGSTLKYAYDANGKRVKKELTSGTKTHYVRGAAGETIAIYENGTRKSINLLTAGGDMIGTYDGSQRRYFIKDHLGSVRTTVDQNGAVDGYDDYYAFGLAMPGRSSNSANPTDNYKFTGHERDEEAGLTIDYMNARTYDPIIGRFLQVDPVLEFATPYSYVGSNPLNLIDPTGMMSADPCCINFQYVARYALAPLENLWNRVVGKAEKAKPAVETVVNAPKGSDVMEASDNPNVRKVGKALGGFGTVVDGKEVLEQARATDPNNPEQMGDLIELGVQKSIEQVPFVGEATGIIMEDSKKPDGNTNLKNRRMSNSYKGSNNQINAWLLQHGQQSRKKSDNKKKEVPKQTTKDRKEQDRRKEG